MPLDHCFPKVYSFHMQVRYSIWTLFALILSVRFGPVRVS